MSAKTRRDRYYAKPANRKKANAHNRAREAAKKAEPVINLDPWEYRRGIMAGLTAGAAIAWNFNAGRSWSNIEIAKQIMDLTKDLPAAITIIGDALVDDAVPHTADLWTAFWAPRK